VEDWNPAVVKMLNIFMPTTFDRRAAIRTDSRFVHYTTAENLFRVLDRQEVWFRNTRCMNDHRDVEHGIAQLNQWINDAGSTASLVRALDASVPGAWEEALKKYQHWMPGLRAQSYVLSVAEQDPVENAKGRLSMWRAFDRGTIGVAVVVDVAPFLQVTEALKAYSSPVAYWNRQQFEEEFKIVAQRVLANQDFVSKLPRPQLVEMVFLMLLFAATCSKHPGLQDEREWRVLTNPLVWPSTQLLEHHDVIGGIPQTVYRLPLKNNPAVGLTGIELPDLIDHVIIGPTQHAGPIRDAIVAKLAERNVEDPWSKVFASGLPARTVSMGEPVTSR
jgi:hypothetical protein